MDKNYKHQKFLGLDHSVQHEKLEQNCNEILVRLTPNNLSFKLTCAFSCAMTNGQIVKRLAHKVDIGRGDPPCACDCAW